MGYEWNGTVTKGTPGKANWTYNVGDPIVYGFWPDSDNDLGVEGYGYMYLGHSNYNDSTPQKDLKAFYEQMNDSNFFPVTTYKTARLSLGGKDDGYDRYSNVDGTIERATAHLILQVADPTKPLGENITYRVFTKSGLFYFDPNKPHSSYKGIPVFDDEAEMRKWLLSDSQFVDSSSSSDIAAKGGYEGYLYLNGLTRYYEIDESNYGKLSKAIQDGIFAGNIADGIVDIKGIIAPGELNTQAKTTIFSDVEGNPVSIQGQEFDFGTFTFNEQFRNFLDYGESTSIKLYLPYCGMQTLDPSIVMGGTIHLKGVIDIITGNILYYVEISNATLSSSSTTVIYNWNGNVACELPIGAEDYGSKVMGIVSSTIQTAGSLAIAPSGVGAALGTAGSLNNLASAVLSNKYVNVGSISSNNGMGGVQYPFIVVTSPIPEYPANYAHHVGYPSKKTQVLGNLTGYTKVEQVHLEGFSGATNDELNEIQQLLTSGVIL